MSTTVQGLILAVSSTFVVAGLAVDSSEASHTTASPARVAPVSGDNPPRWEVELNLEASASPVTPDASGTPFPAEPQHGEASTTVES